MSASLPASWVVVLLIARSARGAYAAALRPAVCAGRVHLWEIGTETYSLTRVCPAPAAAGAAASTVDGDAWPVLQHLVAEGALAAPRGFAGQSGWVQGWPFANEVQAHPLSLATIPTDRYIVFQPDGMLCGPTSAAALDAFAPYSYVGAPWPWEVAKNDKATGGNGGFSLRNKSIILRIVAEFGGSWNNEFEDGWFGSKVERVGGALPPPAVAGTWATETMYTVPPLGFHKPWTHIPELGGVGVFAKIYRDCAVMPHVMALLNLTFDASAAMPEVVGLPKRQRRALAAPPLASDAAYRALQRAR
jgi:hypothetical protein